MKKHTILTSVYISLACLFFLLPESKAQQAVSKVKNAITVTVPTQPVTTASAINTNNSITSVQYSDGLGRNHVTVAKTITPAGKDLVSMVTYDEEGEVKESWLPVPVASQASLPTSAYLMSTARTFYNDTHPYNQREKEREIIYTEHLTPAGKDWHANNKKETLTIYPNVPQEDAQRENAIWAVARYEMEGEGVRLKGYYPGNALQGQLYKDEDGKQQMAFYDAEGKLILERKILTANTFYDTYHVYDEKGLLRFVLSPEATHRMKSASTIYKSVGGNTKDNPVDQYCYIYKYDNRNRCTEKKLPGADWIYYIYDKAGRQVLTQDGNQREKKEWSFTIYDNYGRVIQRGTVTITSYSYSILKTWAEMRVYTEAWTANGYSTTPRLFLQSPDTRVVHQNYYYDNYEFLDIPAYADIRSKLAYKNIYGFDEKGERIEDGVDISTLGMLTGSESKLLDGTGATTEAYYYDKKGRMIQTRFNNHFNGQGYRYYKYNFDNTLQVSHIYQPQSVIGAVPYIRYYYNYDRRGRHTSTDQEVGGNGGYGARIDSLEYDELGRVKRKLLHQNSYQISYAYNIHNQLKEISSPLFSQTLYYNDGTDYKYYNGNVSAINENLQIRGSLKNINYGFTYDGVNRIQFTSIQANVFVNNLYDTRYTYDRNGNITKQVRKGTVQTWYQGKPSSQTYNENVDDLVMSYAGNQLITTVDQTTEKLQEWAPSGETDFRERHPLPSNSSAHYLYDKNGNLKADHHKNIAWVQYNSVNLPSKIQMGNGDKTEYLYDGSGVKRQAKYTIALNAMQIPMGDETKENNNNINTVIKRDYSGEYVFKDGAIERIHMPGGYMETTPGRNLNYWKRVYQITDHLGNVRAEIATEKLSGASTCSLRSSAAYYPFGMEMSFFNVNTSTLPYQMSANELERTNTNWHDFNHRWYDQQLGRFLSIDPLAEMDYATSPYAYCNNNPVNFIDPMGLSTQDKDDNKKEKPSDYNQEKPKGLAGATINGKSYGGGGSWSAYTTLNFGKNWEQQEHYKRMDETAAKFRQELASFQKLIASQDITRLTEDIGPDVLSFADKHFNGQLGLASTALTGYTKLHQDYKRGPFHKLSKIFNTKSGKMYQGTKSFVKSASKSAGKIGPVGTILSIGVIAIEVKTDTWDAHTIVNGALLVGGIVGGYIGSPVILTGIAAYGIGDYLFDWGGTIDKHFGRESGFWD